MEPDQTFSPTDPSANKPQEPDSTAPENVPATNPQLPETPASPKTDLRNYQFDKDDITPSAQVPGGEVRPGGVDATQPLPQQPQPSQQPTMPMSGGSTPVANPLTSMTSSSPVHSANNWQRWRGFHLRSKKSAQGGDPTASVFGMPQNGGNKKLKTLIIAGAAVVLLGGAASAYYFGYYMNPNVIWSQSLGNTAKGYDKLVDYLNATADAHYKGVAEAGNFKYQAGGANYDGSMSFKSDGNNGTGSVEVGLGVTRVNVQLRAVKATNADSPDLYLQMNGITGLGDFLGSDFGKKVNGLNGQWIVFDRTFLEDIQSQIAKSSSKNTTLKWSDVASTAKALGDVNKQYVFTDNKSKSITTVVKKYGEVTVDGHKTYHYQVGFVKQNVKSYITAVRDALKSSKLGTWLQAQTGKSVDDLIGYTELQKSADNIKSSDTVDVWTDTKTRLIYKVHVNDKTNSAENYAEIGLNYKGGDIYPFFINSKFKADNTTSTGSVTLTLNTKTNEFAVAINDTTSGDSKSSFTGSFTLKPSNEAVKVTAPSGGKSISQVLDELGLSSLMDEILSSAAASAEGSSSIGSLGSSL